ncbi:zinc finger protein 2 homolog [Chrysoperla carnea]|uniref:zinc finger protein 2 homolog n=1 Tax=Chrysoperla carnea TaxID=189513 RepID=UPI001D05CB14|nr:zinc finger protein 2 homolog [Chrysoperla carnea]
MEYDLENICRVCLSEGVMMSIFKVNISKKIMACSTVQVWQNDGLPSQICNKCVAKLHIAFQFKKQCEKSDAKLRLYINNSNNSNNSNENKVQMEIKPIIQTPSTENCDNNQVYNECPQNIELQSNINIEPRSDTLSVEPQQCRYTNPQTVSSSPQIVPQISYTTSNMNIAVQPQNHIHLHTYNIQTMGHVQFPSMYNVPTLGVNQVQISQSGNNILQPSLVTQLPPTQIQNSQVPILQNEQPIPQQTQIEVINPKEELEEKVNIKKKNKSPRSISKGNTQCETCGKTFPTATKCARHMKTHSSNMPYKCKLCNRAFAHSGNYKIHLRMHTGELPFKCTVCNKGCRQQQDLEKHMRTHTGERPHQCQMCPRAFSTSSNLIAHVRTHTGEKPYVCCVCQKAFCQSNELTKHMRTHTGEKSHACLVCHKEFNGSSTLIVHMRTHTGERPYVCPTCNKGFAQSSCLSIHMKRHLGEKNYHCSECNRSFVVSGDLKEHAITHAKDKPFVCNYCEKRFVRLNDLHKHIKVFHKATSSD